MVNPGDALDCCMEGCPRASTPAGQGMPCVEGKEEREDLSRSRLTPSARVGCIAVAALAGLMTSCGAANTSPSMTTVDTPPSATASSGTAKPGPRLTEGDVREAQVTLMEHMGRGGVPELTQVTR